MNAIPMRMNLPIVKVDEEQRIVWGIATKEEIDKHGDIVDYAASKRAFAGWIGNIREMHGDKAVGKRIDVQFDDENQQVMIGAYISRSADGENAWQKVKEEILRGFSIGGRMNAIQTKSVDGEDVRVITDYELTEVSLVDNPACPSALFQMVKSANGGLEYTEEIQKAPGRPVRWYEVMYKYSLRDVMDSSVLVYDDNRMNKSNDIKKDVWSASELIYIAQRLAEHIYMMSWEGEDASALIDALKAVKDAAAMELGEDETWPQAEMALALKTLNLTKQEVEAKMAAKDKQNVEVEKTVTGSEDRDANAEVVTTAEENGRPVNDTAERAEEAGVEVGETNVSDGTEVVSAEEAEEVAEAVADEASKDDAVDGKPEKGKKSDDSDDLNKSTDTTQDLAKSILSGVEKMIDEKIAPLKEQVEKFSTAPAAPKSKGVHTVEKAEVVKDEMSDAEAELESLLKEADALAGTEAKSAAEFRKRTDLAKKIRVAQSMADPARRAKYAEIRAQYPENR